MGYLSFDASVKIHQSGKFTSTKTNKTGFGGINGYIRHIDRGTDKKNGHGDPGMEKRIMTVTAKIARSGKR